MFIDDEDKSKIGMVLFCKGYNESEHDLYNQIAFLFLDESLGEFDTETYIGSVIIQGFDSEYFESSKEIESLAAEFDRLELKC